MKKLHFTARLGRHVWLPIGEITDGKKWPKHHAVVMSVPLGNHNALRFALAAISDLATNPPPLDEFAVAVDKTGSTPRLVLLYKGFDDLSAGLAGYYAGMAHAAAVLYRRKKQARASRKKS